MNTTQAPLHPTATTFDREVLGAEAPVLVEFWAPWCGPCLAFKPVVQAVAGQRGLTVAFVNVDEQPELAQRFGVLSIPALKLFRAGQLAGEATGAQSKSALENWLDARGV